jgi:hypothetical protein
MSDILEDYYGSYCPRRIPTAKSRRSKQIAAKKFRLPVIKIGNTTLIDPQAGDDRLREFARGAPEPRRRRGRPRTGE